MTIVRKDYPREIAAAFRAGDLDAMLSIAMELAGRDAMFVARLEADNERKRRSRTGRKSQEVTGSHVTGREIPPASPFSPGPPFSSPTSTTAAIARDADADRVAAAKAELVMKLGGGVEVVSAVDRFADAVPVEKRYPWLTGMATWLKPITGGKGHAPDVMLDAMADWLIADRGAWPWEGRKFRSFMRDIERQRAQPAPTNTPRRVVAPGEDVAQRHVDEIRKLIQTQDRSRFIRREAVEALGPQVLAAYLSLGGPDRFLNEPAARLPFLVKDFAAAMRTTHA